jgi:hypothetical protein
MKNFLVKLISLSVAGFLSLSIILVNAGCEGSESRKAIDDTVESAAGMDAVKKKEMIEKKLNESYQKEAERTEKGLDGDSTDSSGDNQEKDR